MYSGSSRDRDEGLALGIRAALTLLILALALALPLVLSGCTSEDTVGEDGAVPVTFIEFFDPKCPYCAEMEPTVEALEEKYADRLAGWEIIDVTTDAGREDVDSYGVFITPTFVILDADGEEMDRITGATTEENMIAFIDRAIADATGEATGPRPDIEGEGSTIGE